MEIKFKLVDVETGKVIGYEYLTETGWKLDLQQTVGINGTYPCYSEDAAVPVDRFQYINSFDKNGNEVYDGDLLLAPSGVVFTVSWFAEKMRWSMVADSGEHFNLNMGILEILTEEHLKPYNNPA